MGQAKARGTLEERIAQAVSGPPKTRKMSKREEREEIAKAVGEYAGQVFRKMCGRSDLLMTIPRDSGYPYQAVLIESPGSEYARENMTVGNEYTVKGVAGGCVFVTTDVEDDTTIINPCWLKRI